MVPGTIEDVTVEDWQLVLDVNLNGPFLGCRAAFAALKDSGSGAIVNVSSNSILQGYGIYPAYTAAKGGLDNLTRSIAAHCRMKGLPVRCNSVLPGGIDTPLAREGIRRDMGLDPDGDDPMAAGFIAMLGQPAQVADVIVFLCSPEASLMNGETVLVDGGLTRTVPIG
jgi:NAD(P)-dependent dehydrogenase (short-subunit alcohol dehydrogenase family)